MGVDFLIALLISLVFCGVLLAYGAWVSRKRLQRTATERDAQVLLSRFVAYCTERGVPPDAIDGLHRYFQEWKIDGFPVDLDDELGIDDQDLPEAIGEAAVLCKLEPDVRSLEGMKVRDFINALTKNVRRS